MDFNLPADLVAYLDELDRFIAREIKPLEEADDNIRFFDHRREWARTDFDNGGLPRHEWEALLRKAKDRADAAGHLRFAIPKRYGGKDGSNLWMAVIREHFASKGLGLHNDLQNEHSIVGNLPIVTMLDRYGTDEQKAMIDGSIRGKYRITFGLTEPEHGSDATHMETKAKPATRDNVKGWLIDGEKMWTTGMHVATHCALFARTSGNDGDARGITCFLVPAKSCGREGRGVHVDLQHADRPSPRQLHRRVRARGCAVRRGRQGTVAGAMLRAREPHPPGREFARRRRLLHRRERQIRAARENRSARRWRRTRRSSGRWSSWRRRPRCCGF